MIMESLCKVSLIHVLLAHSKAYERAFMETDLQMEWTKQELFPQQNLMLTYHQIQPYPICWLGDPERLTEWAKLP